MSKVEVKLPFGLDGNGMLLHVSDVVRGAECGCSCPACKKPLVAHKGSKNQHHFKHASLTDCDGGLETVIHRAAKQIIRERKSLVLPEFIATTLLVDSRGVEHKNHCIVVQDRTIVRFESVEEEVSLGDIRADLLATVSKKPLIIEIFYRHLVEEEKVRKIERSKTSAVEIDLSDLTPEDVKNWDPFWGCVNDPQRVKWLYNSKADEVVVPKLKTELALKVQGIEQTYRVQDRKQKDREVRERAELATALKEIELLSSFENVEKLRSEADCHPLVRSNSKLLPFSLEELPRYLDVNVPNGDWIFNCDRRIWQSAFYTRFILNSSPKANNSLATRWGDEWLQSDGNCVVSKAVQKVGILGRRYPDLIPQHLKELPSTWRTLRAYCEYLEMIGLLYFTGYETKNPGSAWFKITAQTPSTFRYQPDPREDAYYLRAGGTIHGVPQLLALES